MKIENIHVGFVANNYKHLCTALEDKYTDGSSKKSQIARWACYFAHERKGNQWIITEIFDTPKPLPQRGGDRNVITYIETLKKLLMELLLSSDSESVNLGKNRLLNVLNMVNSNYRECSRFIPNLSLYMGIDEPDIHEFYGSVNSTLKGNLEKALNQLKSTNNIYYSQQLMVCKHGEIRPADENEYKIIFKARDEVLDELGYAHKGIAYVRGQYDKYTRMVNELLQERAEIKYVYEAYDIKLNRERMEREYIKMLNDEKFAFEQELNGSIQERITLNINNRHTNAIAKDDDWFQVLSYREGRRITEQYVTDQIRLLDTLINPKHEDIYIDVKKIKKNKDS